MKGQCTDIMIVEERYVKTMFQKHFGTEPSQKTAIYGLGKNTKLLLDTYPECNIAGLMDEVRTGETIWGKPVIDCEQAHRMGVARILILAKAANVPIIFQRIENDCRKYGISVYDINGNLVVREEKGFLKHADAYMQCKKVALMEKIRRCDVVSFDIFDTLLIRNVLYPMDVFLHVEELARRKGIIPADYDYYKQRIRAERELYLHGHPTIHDIYGKMAEDGELSILRAELLKELELNVEAETLTGRREVIDLFYEAQRMGKTVCCTSDMYLTKDMIGSLLEKNGVHGMDALLVSCEEGASKSDGLFQILKAKYPDKRILHIGDHEEADIHMAEIYGIQEHFWIPGVRKMLEDSLAAELWEYTDRLDERDEIGRFIAGQFQNPFLFASTQGKCRIDSCYQMGYEFIEPIVSCAVFWLVGRCREDGIDTLLLGARDGWLIREMLDRLTVRQRLDFDYTYLHCSRSACTLAGMMTEEDVVYAASLAYSGSTGEMLRNRFLLDDEEIMHREAGEEDEHYILRHTSTILKHAAEYKKNFQVYLKEKHLYPLNRKTAYFDFVSSGTCQLWLENILEDSLHGLYFMKLYDKKKEKLDIQSLFMPSLVYEIPRYKITGHYFFMENILSSPEASLRYIGKDGGFVFEKENRHKKQIEDMKEIQRGILDAFEKRLEKQELSYVPEAVADRLLGLVGHEHTVMNMDYFSDNILRDEFCNREFDLEGMME